MVTTTYTHTHTGGQIGSETVGRLTDKIDRNNSSTKAVSEAVFLLSRRRGNRHVSSKGTNATEVQGGVASVGATRSQPTALEFAERESNDKELYCVFHFIPVDSLRRCQKYRHPHCHCHCHWWLLTFAWTTCRSLGLRVILGHDVSTFVW